MIKLRPSIEIIKRTCRYPIRGAEIGVLGGTNAISMAEHLTGLTKLHLIDSYGGLRDTDEKFLTFKAKFKELNNIFQWHIKTSMEALADFAAGQLDFVYIDANHRYFEVARDIRGWWEKIRIGGVIAGHDYFSHGSVKKAVTDWAAETNNYVFSTYPDWWVFKD